MEPTAQQIKDLNDNLNTSLMKLDQKLSWIAKNTRVPIHDRTLRIVLKTHGNWYPFNIPEDTRKFFIQQMPQTAVLLIQFGETSNMQEQPQSQNYSTLAASTNGRWYEGRTKGTIFFQDATNDGTIVEVEVWR